MGAPVDVHSAAAEQAHDIAVARKDILLLTDGLRAEREQGITIDVASRCFATPRRTFIPADTPGHVQYTRNTVTGASTADLSPSCSSTRARARSSRAGGTRSSSRCCGCRTSSGLTTSTTTAAAPGRSPAACCAPATRCRCCPAA
jgi:hypothetical protein